MVTSSARTADERKRYQLFLTKSVHLYSSKPITNSTVDDRRYEGFNRFDTNPNDEKYYDRTQLNAENNQFNRYDSNRAFGNVDNSFSTERSVSDNDTQMYEKFELFESKRYGARLNLMFQDAARNLVPIKEDDQSFIKYLGQSMKQILDIRHCPVGRMTLCVTSDAELEKCVKMRVSYL